MLVPLAKEHRYSRSSLVLGWATVEGSLVVFSGEVPLVHAFVIYLSVQISLYSGGF